MQTQLVTYQGKKTEDYDKDIFLLHNPGNITPLFEFFCEIILFSSHFPHRDSNRIKRWEKFLTVWNVFREISKLVYRIDARPNGCIN